MLFFRCFASTASFSLQSSRFFFLSFFLHFHQLYLYGCYSAVLHSLSFNTCSLWSSSIKLYRLLITSNFNITHSPRTHAFWKGTSLVPSLRKSGYSGGSNKNSSELKKTKKKKENIQTRINDNIDDDTTTEVGRGVEVGSKQAHLNIKI